MFKIVTTRASVMIIWMTYTVLPMRYVMTSHMTQGSKICINKYKTGHIYT